MSRASKCGFLNAEGIGGPPCLNTTAHCIRPPALSQKRSWSFPTDILQPSQWPGDRNIHGHLFSWQTIRPPRLHLAAFLLHPRLLLESSKPQATPGQSSHVRAVPGTKENYWPQEANTAWAESRVSIPLFCVIKGPIVETQITQRWHVWRLIT